MDNLLKIAIKTADKAVDILSKTWGWVSVIATSILAYFHPALYIYYAILAIIFLDAVLGVLVAKKRGDYTQSYLGRETGWKVLFYTIWFASVYLFETTLGTHTVYGLLFSFAIAAVVELISIAANGLILKPNFVFFKAIMIPLKGEVATKLGISESEVEEILASKEVFKEKMKTNKENKTLKKKGKQ